MPHPIGTHYYLIHFLGILLVYSGYGALIARGMLGSESPAMRKFGSIASGLGLFFILLGGFGLIAKLEYAHYTDLWVILKIVLFLLLGSMTALINRKPGLSQVWYWTILLIGLAATATALYKPGAGV